MMSVRRGHFQFAKAPKTSSVLVCFTCALLHVFASMLLCRSRKSCSCSQIKHRQTDGSGVSARVLVFSPGALVARDSAFYQRQHVTVAFHVPFCRSKRKGAWICTMQGRPPSIPVRDLSCMASSLSRKLRCPRRRTGPDRLQVRHGHWPGKMEKARFF